MNSALEAWKVAESEYPADGPLGAQLAFAVRYAILAPSIHNTQPWLFHVAGESVELFADRLRGLAVADPEDRELTISCGAALLQLHLALRYFAWDVAWELLPEGPRHDLLARVRVGGRRPPTEEERACFKAIVRRHSTRLPFAPEPVPERLVSALVLGAAEEGARLHVLRHAAERAALSRLVGEADRAQMRSLSYRRELASWIHPNRSRSRDGMPGYALGYGELRSLTRPAAVRYLERGLMMSGHDEALVADAPLLAVVHTHGDEPLDWLHAGAALARVLLRATAEGFTAAFHDQPLQLVELRDSVARELEIGGHAQAVLRFGKAPEVKPTPRRLAREVLLENGAIG